MKKPKIIVMDMGGTLLDSNDVNFELGVKYIYDNYCIHDTSYDALLEDYKLICESGFKKRDNDNFELNFHNALNYVDKVIGFNAEVDYYQIEKEFVDVTMPRILVDGVDLFLETTKKLQIPVYVLSNSCFSSEELKHELKEFKIENYFKDVLSSGDYLMRKPSEIFYRLIIKTIKRKYPDISLNDIWYIGNDYRCDVVGASSSGLTSVWLNRLNQKNINNLNIIEVNSYSALIKRLTNE